MIFHITPRADWEAAQTKGEYLSDSLRLEGFIHCSTLAQMLRNTIRDSPALSC
jgi:uncharacterized protein (DUF952 family)